MGEKVLAYNPTSHKMELEPVLHVWINHDTDLVDLTLTRTTHAPHSAILSKTSEVLHTNKKHPFLTKEKGFVPVSRLKLGMHVLEANGTYGVVTGWKIVPGAKTMYNLEVAQDHTFTVGSGEWVVHNCGAGLPKPLTDLQKSGYQLEQHFMDRWSGWTKAARGAGRTAQDVVDVLQNGYHYYRTGDEISANGTKIFSATKGGLTILYTEGKNALFDIIERGVPRSGITPLRNMIPDWTNPFYDMDLMP